MNKEREPDQYFWQERGEKIFLYIIVAVLIMVALLFYLIKTASGQEYSQIIISKLNQVFGSSLEINADQEIIQFDSEEEVDEMNLNPDQNEIKLPKLSVKKNLMARKTAVISTAVGDQLEKELDSLSTNNNISAIIKEGKYIDVDISSQTLTLFQNGNRVGSYPISSGSSSYPTPQGVFSVNSKSLNAYSSKYNLYMPYWMAFIGSLYGIHELPEYSNGYKEGREYLGQAVSHGCIRLGVGAAARVYSWTPVGTSVIVHY